MIRNFLCGLGKLVTSLIALINDLCIIETEDALVVVHENNVEDVRQAVSLFKKNATPKEISF